MGWSLFLDHVLNRILPARRQRAREQNRKRPDLHFILYTRHSCPLCDEALDLLKEHQLRHAFTLETRNVDDSPDLQQAYGNWVPVVTINGRLRFRGHINPVLLQRILDAPA